MICCHKVEYTINQSILYMQMFKKIQTFIIIAISVHRCKSLSTCYRTPRSEFRSVFTCKTVNEMTAFAISNQPILFSTTFFCKQLSYPKHINMTITLSVT